VQSGRKYRCDAEERPDTGRVDAEVRRQPEGDDRLQHRYRRSGGRHDERARQHGRRSKNLQRGAGFARCPLGGQRQPDEGDRPQRGQRRDDEEGQLGAAHLVQPPADERSDHEAEVRAGHHDSHHAPALGRTVEISDEREPDDPGNRICGPLNQPRREQPRQAIGERHDRRRHGQADQTDDHRRPAA
jgi:hypothetical protein